MQRRDGCHIQGSRHLWQGAYAWNSPGSSYDDWYDGASITGQLVPRVSHGILKVNDPILSLPSFEKSRIITSAYCTFVSGKGLNGATLYSIVCAMNAALPEDLP